MKEEKKFSGKQRMNNRQLVILAIIVIIMTVITIFSLIYIRKQMGDMQQKSQPYVEYRRHYAFITEFFEENFWSEVYDGAKRFGEGENVYLEWIGQGMDIDYSKEDLLKTAIASKVDGIILEGEESEEIRTLINLAAGEGIPIVTVMTDSYDSKRQSFVGIGSYDLGREYGRQIIRIATKDTKDVLILMNAASKDSGQNIIYNGMQETLANEGNHLSLDIEILAISEDIPFSDEEAIRDIFLNREKLPDIIICLNEKNTVSAYQAAIDYNLVGEVDILGYSVTDTILNAIHRKVVAATVAVDAVQMGIRSMKALDEYVETGHVSDYVTMDVYTVTSNNIKRYLRDAAEEKEE